MRHHARRLGRRARSAAAATLAAGAVLSVPAHAAAAVPPMPTLVPELDWLRMPNGWVIGDITAVAVDRHDNLWLLHRPRSVGKADAARAAPPIMAFDSHGNFLRAFGGEGSGYDWPTVEHSLAVDGKGRVWVAGAFRTDPHQADDMLLVFSGEGRFIRQIGRRGGSKGDADTGNFHAPADIFVDDAAREVYVADGYGNRRVIVLNSETGAFKRMWSAFGAPPPNDPAPEPRAPDAPFAPQTGDGPAGFNGVHGVEISRDRLIYVSDRNNQRIQVFTSAGRYLRQVFIDRNMPSPQTASGIAFSADPRQCYLYVADWGNARIVVLDRKRLSVLGSIGGKGSAPGQFNGPHLSATDSKGVLYVAEVQGRRVQKLTPGNIPSGCRPRSRR
ncbi:hypothetical protein [Sphingomonas profundi]|uniref:hypothetical protein n=1 Tax=Alterirhizorhabdus profundi TaxID=2681549 RepID=UPI001E3D7A0B|nr:hypothetical protein [Sphingomonas profundi]